MSILQSIHFDDDEMAINAKAQHKVGADGIRRVIIEVTSNVMSVTHSNHTTWLPTDVARRLAAEIIVSADKIDAAESEVDELTIIM